MQYMREFSLSCVFEVNYIEPHQISSKLFNNYSQNTPITKNSERILLKRNNISKAYQGRNNERNNSSILLWSKLSLDERWKPLTACANTDRIFQEGALFPWLTVYENIEFELKVSKLSRYEGKDVR